MGRKLQPCNLTEEEQSAAWSELQDGPYREDLEEVGEAMTQYLFYSSSRKKNERECICTHRDCGKFILHRDQNPGFFRKRHGEEVSCPRCGQPVNLVSLGRMRSFNKLNDTPWIRVTMCKTGIDGALLLKSGYAKRTFCWNDLRPYPEISWKTWTYLKPGKRMQWVRSWEPAGQRVDSSWWWDWKWTPQTAVKEPFNPGMRGCYGGGSDGGSFFVGFEAVERSAFKYCQVEEWYYKEAGVFLDQEDDMVRNVVKYLSAYTRYPAMEMAVKLDFHQAATELAVEGRKNTKYLNWDANSVQGFLRMSKQDAKAFIHAGGDLELLKVYQDARKKKLVADVPAFMSALQDAGGLRNGEKLVRAAGAAGCSLRQASNYLVSLPEGIDLMATMWVDYLNMAKVLEYDLSRRDVAMPKNLRERHDLASETVRYQRVLIDEQKHKKFNEYLRKMYEFEYGNLCIVVPGGVDDIVHEGKVLKHCVGGYAARHFNDQVNILFLRHKRKPATPFITIEIRPRKTMKEALVIRQIHGYQNEGYLQPAVYGSKQCNARPEYKYKWFLDIWKAWVKAGSPRNKKGKPIVPKEKEKTA